MKFSFWNLLCPFLCTLTLSASKAQDSVGTLTMTNDESGRRFFHNKAEGEVKVEGTQYQSSIPEDSRLDQSLMVSAHLKATAETTRTKTALDFTAERYVDWETSYFSVPELYWNAHWRDQKSQVSVGRKVEFWSQADRDWHLGIWQPKSEFDLLRPQEQGLTGVFYRHEQGSLQFLAFASPVFIPSMGADVQEKDGNLVAASRWYRSPSSQVILFGKTRRATYNLDVPETQDVVQNGGGGGRLLLNPNEKGLWSSVNYGYKPMNKLVLTYDKKLASVEAGEDTGLATVVPTVGYHTLFGADLGYRFEQAAVSVSYLEDRPRDLKETPREDYYYQSPNPMKAYSVRGETRVQVPGFEEPVGFVLGYLRVDGADIQDFAQDGEEQTAFFTQRQELTHAASISAEFSTIAWKNKMKTRVKYLREFDQRGMIGNLEVSYFPATQVALTVGADVLGVDEPTDAEKDSGFLNDFRANDRIYGGISYVF